jgi:interferon gamma-inducible protein 30
MLGKFLALAVVLVVCASAADKVQIDVYAESLCPDCREYVTGQLEIAFNTANLSEIADINVWPYGNAHESQISSTYSFTCQHGAEECAGNLMETCALYKLNNHDYLNFFICLESQISDSGTFAVAGPICAQKVNIDFSEIQSCISRYSFRNIFLNFSL